MSRHVRKESSGVSLVTFLTQDCTCLVGKNHKLVTEKERATMFETFRCMDVMLSGLKAFQDGNDPRAKGVHLKLMDHWVTVDLKVPILLISIQDGKQGDQILGRYTNHTEGIVRQYRGCNVGLENLDNVTCRCVPNKISVFSKLCAEGSDEDLQQHFLYLTMVIVR